MLLRRAAPEGHGAVASMSASVEVGQVRLAAPAAHPAFFLPFFESDGVSVLGSHCASRAFTAAYSG